MTYAPPRRRVRGRARKTPAGRALARPGTPPSVREKPVYTIAATRQPTGPCGESAAHRLAHPTHLPEVRDGRHPHVAAQPQGGPDRLQVRPVDADRLADDQRPGHLPALAARRVPALPGVLGVELVDPPPVAAVAAPGAVVPEHHVTPFRDRVLLRPELAERRERL